MDESGTADRFEIWKVIGRRRVAIGLIVAILLVLLAILIVRTGDNQKSTACIGVENTGEKLAYVSADDRLMLYDPRSRTETKLLEDVDEFAVSRRGCVAFTRGDEMDRDLYIFDPSLPEQAPVKISHHPELNHFPLAWSPDGHYLAYSSYPDWNDQDLPVHTLYVWNGKTVTDIVPVGMLGTPGGFYVDWSQDDRLAFAIGYWLSSDTPPEIYVWDGTITSNVSQNPEGWDSDLRWSNDGQLMFSSTYDDDYAIYVWDGVSFKNGSPDHDMFVRVAPQLQPRNSNWVDSGIVQFNAEMSSSPSDASDLVLWDMDTESIVKQYKISSKHWNSWLADGGQFIFSSKLASGIPSFYLDIETTEGEIVFSEHVGEYAWSPDGYLAYCGIEDGYSKILTLWDGVESWVVARTSYRPAQWLNGESTFSCNNG